MASENIISVKFLENLLHKKVESFKIEPGSNVGDNFMSILYAIEVQVINSDGTLETVHLLSKCYPSHPMRQQFLNKSNIFWNELSIYSKLLPELYDFSKRYKIWDSNLFPPLVGGKAINFKESQDRNETQDRKIYEPFDIYIAMIDMRKFGFRMGNRRLGLTFDETKLVMIAQARLHAMSWGYKQRNGLKALTDKFDFVTITLSDKGKDNWINVLEHNVMVAASAVEAVHGKNAAISERARNYKNYTRQLFEITFTEIMSEDKFYDAHRVLPFQLAIKNDPWRVLIHGDAWTNNLLFRYEGKDNRPVEVVFVDLQLMREHCPTIDLAYVVYSSTSPDFRKGHLATLLEIYFQEFTECCKKMEVGILPNFTIEELTRRFHRAKIFGYFVGTMAIPIMLKEDDDAVDLEHVSGENFAELLKNLSVKNDDIDGSKSSPIFKRLVELAEELFDEGVL